MQQRAQGRTARILDIVVNLATLATCAVVCVVVVGRYWASTATDVDYLPVNSEAPEVSRIDYRVSRATILIGVRSNCSYCADSMPTYRELAGEVAEARKGGVRLVFVGSEDDVVMRAYLAEHGVPSIPFAHVTPGSPLVRATPTLVVVGWDGKIRGSWIGRLDRSRIREVLRAMP